MTEIDENLWFRMESCCDGKHYLLHNAHTFPGRINAWCSSKQIRFRVSKVSIEQCSVESRYWIKGFLAGSEPDAPKDENKLYFPSDHPVRKRWQEMTEEFEETGIWRFDYD